MTNKTQIVFIPAGFWLQLSLAYLMYGDQNQYNLMPRLITIDWKKDLKELPSIVVTYKSLKGKRCEYHENEDEPQSRWIGGRCI